MSDSRIAILRDAVLALSRGELPVSFNVPGSDEVADLAKALSTVSTTLEARFEELRRLVALTEQVNAGLVLDEVLDHVYTSFRSVIPYDRIGFSLLEDGGTTVRARWARTESATPQIPVGYSAPLAGSSLEPLLRTHEPRVLNDLVAYLRVHPSSEPTRLIVAEGMRSSLTVPLVAMGRAVGFMFFTSRQAYTYTHAHVELFRQIAGQLALCVEKGRLYQQLLELNDTKSRFLGMAAHDLRNPISVVRAFVELLRDETLPAEQRSRILDIMDASCGDMLALIADLLDLTSIEEGRLVLDRLRVDVDAWLRNTTRGLELLARRKEIALHVDAAPDAGDFLIDPRRMDQVVGNLVSNAIKFSYPHSDIHVSAARNGSSVVLTVRDQGQGIRPQDMGRLFVRFGKTASRPTGGEASTGLGLAIAKSIVVAHGGQVAVESTLGVGSTFTITVPAEPAD